MDNDTETMEDLKYKQPQPKNIFRIKQKEMQFIAITFKTEI